MACRNHPQVDTGLEHCYRCGHRFCEECRVEFQGKSYCAACKADVVGRLETGGLGDEQAELPPWERRQELGMASAMWATITAVLGAPGRFFLRMDRTVTTWDCLAVACVVQTLWTFTYVLSLGALFALGFGLAASEAGAEAEPFAMAGMMMVGILCSVVVFAPVSAIINAFLGAGMIHIFLVVTGKATASFQQTVRGYCYAQAPYALGVVPVIGHAIGMFWMLWTSVCMVRGVHRTSPGIAWLSVLWFPLLLFAVACGFSTLAGILGQAG